MGVFDKSTKTATVVPDPKTDCRLAPSGALNYGAMTSATALATTNGTDAKLIHGNRWQEIEGSLHENIHQHQITTVDQNQTLTVNENQKVRVEGTTNDTRVDSVLQTFINTSMFHYNMARIEEHKAPEQIHNPTETLQKKQEEHENHYLKTDWVLSEFTAKGVVGEAKLVNLEHNSTELCSSLLSVEDTAWKEKSEALSNHLTSLRSRFFGDKLEAGGPETKILPVIVGICVAVHLDSPMG